MFGDKKPFTTTDAKELADAYNKKRRWFEWKKKPGDIIDQHISEVYDVASKENDLYTKCSHLFEKLRRIKSEETPFREVDRLYREIHDDVQQTFSDLTSDTSLDYVAKHYVGDFLNKNLVEEIYSFHILTGPQPKTQDDPLAYRKVLVGLDKESTKVIEEDLADLIKAFGELKSKVMDCPSFGQAWGLINDFNKNKSEAVRKFETQIGLDKIKTTEEILKTIDGLPDKDWYRLQLHKFFDNQLYQLEREAREAKKQAGNIMISGAEAVPNERGTYDLYDSGRKTAVIVGNQKFDTVVSLASYQGASGNPDNNRCVYEVSPGKFVLSEGRQFLRIGNQYIFDSFEQVFVPGYSESYTVAVGLGGKRYEVYVSYGFEIRAIDGVKVPTDSRDEIATLARRDASLQPGGKPGNTFVGLSTWLSKNEKLN